MHRSRGLSLAFLGGYEVRMDGQPVAGIAYNKMRGLLAYLAVQRERDHPRDELASLLWPENDQVTARGNLRRTLADLRRALEVTGEELFSSTRETIRLLPRFKLDVRDFAGGARSGEEPLGDEAAVALYGGDFLAGFALPECPQFEEWVRDQREALHCHALALLEKLWRRFSESGDVASALRYVAQHARIEPWDEDIHRQAMLLYERAGQKSAALEQYEICRRALEAELGSAPGRQTREIAERIRRGERDAAPASSAPERRPVTVLYCELGTPALDDPDEAMQHLAPVRERCEQLVRRFSGYMARPAQGDGLLAYFGYPRADEHAARRAVQVALAMTREATAEVEVHVGVHTGVVIAGGQAELPDAVGRISKLAARLRDSGATNQVSISGQTHEVVAGYFACTSVGLQRMSGFAQPVEILRVDRETGARTRLDAMARLTPLCGREAEMQALDALWSRARRGARQVVLVRGEPGIGKTRLLHALKERIEGGPGTVRELRCFPEYEQSPFHPLLAMLETVLGFAQSDSPEERFRKLAAHFTRRDRESAARKVPLAAELLSLPLQAGYSPSRVSPQKQKEDTVALLVEELCPPGGRDPVLILAEDLHWIDPSSLEVLGRFLERNERRAVFTVLTCRPEFVSPWTLSGGVLDISPLDAEQATRMVASIGAAVSASTVAQIVERSDGVPLFIEEMTKLAASHSVTAIPPTLHDLLAARIDKLGGAKPTIQLAATLGREFDLALLRKAAAKDAGAVASDLRTLLDAGLTQTVDASTHQFKHALIQEAAYQSQTRADMQATHRRVAEALQRDFAELVASRPELLARHLSASGQTQLAIEYWIRAGQRASRYSAHAEAIDHFDNGLRLLAALPESAERSTVEFNILVLLCPALYATVGYGSERATRANARLSVLAEKIGERPELFEAKWALVMNTIANAGSRGVPARAVQLVGLAGSDPLRRQAAHYAVADSAFWLGEFPLARTHTESAIAFYRPDQHAQLLATFGEDLSVSCGAYLAWSQYFLGDPRLAKRTGDGMLARARELDHPHTLALALCFAAVLHRWLGDVDATLALGAETREVSKRHGFLVWLAAGEMTHGWALARQGRKEGIAEIQSSIAGMKMAIGGISVVFISALAEAYYHLGMHREALAALAEAQAEVQRTGDGHYTAEVLRLEGECLLRVSNSNAARARACFEQALAISRKQGAESLQRLASASLERA